MSRESQGIHFPGFTGMYLSKEEDFCKDTPGLVSFILFCFGPRRSRPEETRPVPHS